MGITNINSTNHTVNQWHIQTIEESTHNRLCFSTLNNVPWARKIIQDIETNGGVKDPRTIGYLFELRFAHELYLNKYEPVHEHPAGINKSTVDFFLAQNPNLLIELVSVNESDYVKGMTYQEDLLDENDEPIGQMGKFLHLSGNAQGKEMITLQQKIGEKVFKDGKATKFPLPSCDSLNIIIVDERGFCGGDGLNRDQRLQLVYGSHHDKANTIYHIDNDPILGLFDLNNKRPYAQLLQERIDAIGFVFEKKFAPDDIASSISYYFNYLRSDYDNLQQMFPFKSKSKDGLVKSMNQRIPKGGMAIKRSSDGIGDLVSLEIRSKKPHIILSVPKVDFILTADDTTSLIEYCEKTVGSGKIERLTLRSADTHLDLQNMKNYVDLTFFIHQDGGVESQTHMLDNQSVPEFISGLKMALADTFGN